MQDQVSEDEDTVSSGATTTAMPVSSAYIRK